MTRRRNPVPEITVYLSSPSDVKDEREIVKHAIQEINADPSWQRRCLLKTLAYEDCVPGQMGKSAQRIVDDHMRLSSEADIVVCIFCNRLGTPTIDATNNKEYLSGTHYEFDSAYSKFIKGGCVSPRILLFLGSRDFPDESSDEDHNQYMAARNFKKRLKSQYEGLYVEYREMIQFESLVRDHLRKHLDSIAEVGPTDSAENLDVMTVDREPLAYLERLVENYRWLKLEGIREAGSLRIELEKVYVALKTEPESEYDRQQAANLHTIEVKESAGVDSIDVIDARRLEELDAENLRRTYRPGREQAKKSTATEVRTLGDAFRQHSKMVILGGPGSGKTTLGRWLALQLARGLTSRAELVVPAQERKMGPNDIRVSVPANRTTAFPDRLFRFPEGGEGTIQKLRIETLPSRGLLKLAGVDVAAGLVLEYRQLNLLTYTPSPNQSGEHYASFELSMGAGEVFDSPSVVVIDVAVHILVPLSQIDPDASKINDELVDLGPVRLPIFLRLAHFARELADRSLKQLPSLELIDYLGRDPDSCSLSDGNTPDSRNMLFRSFLSSNQAVVVLDGLDELGEGYRRTVVLKIQDFVKTLPFENGKPWERGGNQLVVTSRYVGYKFSPVQGDFAHFGIQSMQRPAVERFARSWTDAVNSELATEGQTGVVAEQLIAEIYNGTKPKIRELATNPLLVTILATVYWRDGKLPDQRAGVYDRVVENLLEIWLNREECRTHSLKREELLAALEPLAAEMQENTSSNGLISLTRIGELVEAPLAFMSGFSDVNDRRFRPRRDALLATLRKHVGLLAEQSPGNYAFFHRTFQEFLAARHLLAERPRAAEKLKEKLDDPIWREPLLLALGLAMIEWGPEERSRLLESFLAADTVDSLIPRASLLLVNALPDLRNAPAGVVSQMVMRLLASYSISQELGQSVGLDEQIERAFMRLKDGKQADIVARQFVETLRRPSTGRDLSGAVATLLQRTEWFTTELVEALLVAVHRDQPNHGWPIHRALTQALGHCPGGVPWLSPGPMLNTSRLLSTHLPMRKLLETTPRLVDFVRSDTDWLFLLVALYGGLGQIQLGEQLDKYQQACIKAKKSQANQATVDFDDNPIALAELPVVEFSPQDIVHDLADLDLSRLVQRQLVAQNLASDLTIEFKRRWESSGPKGAAEALVGLAALGEDVVPLLRSALADVNRGSAAEAAIARFRFLKAQLDEPTVRVAETAIRTIPEIAPEKRQLDLLKIALEANVSCGGGPISVSDRIPEQRFVAATSPEVSAAVNAEYWSYLLSDVTDDGRRGSAPFDLVCSQVAASVDSLLLAWSALLTPETVLVNASIPGRSRSSPRPDSQLEQYIAMLDAITSVPMEHHKIAGYVLGTCQQFLKEHPALIFETVAASCSQGEQFVKAFRAYRRNTIEVEVSLKKIEDQFLAATMRGEDSIEGFQMSSWSALFDELLEIQDPFLRFRAMWIFLRTIAAEDEGFEMNVLAWVEQIANPHHKVRAFELILTTIQPAEISMVNHMGLLGSIVKTASLIADPENRARAQCRLAFFAFEHMESLLQNAVESVHSIQNPNRKAETIREIRAEWGTIASVTEALDRLALTIDDPWERDKALGRESRLINTYRCNFAPQVMAWRLPAFNNATESTFRKEKVGPIPWAILYLFRTATEVVSIAKINTVGTANWDRLLTEERADAIIAIIADKLDSGVQVTSREVSILDRVVQSGHAEDLATLWPYLNCPDPGAMGIVARWVSRHDSAGQWSALVQAEAGRLTPEVVSTVIDLLASSNDRLRLRAALGLHGPTPHTENRNRRWSVRKVGVDTVDALARCAVQSSNSPAVQTAFQWVQHDIFHDDRSAIEAWIARAAIDGPSSPASWILKSMQSIAKDCVDPILSAIRSGTPDLQRTLLWGLARLAHCSKGFSEAAKGIHTHIASIPLEIRASVCVVPEGTKTLLEIAKMAADSTHSAAGVPQLRKLLESRLLWLDDSHLTDDQKCLSRLNAIGSQLYIRVGNHWSKTDKVAEPIAQNSRVMELMLSWLASIEVTSDLQGYSHHLLTSIESLARLSPDAFAGIAEPELWEPILTEWAQFGEHWTARRAAMQLLGRLRRVTERGASALRSAMKDVSFVQEAAYAAVTMFRRIEGDILPELLQAIEDSSNGVAAATTRLLVGVAQAEITNSDRRRILRTLDQIAARTSIVHPVYLMQDSNGIMSIRFIDRLERILYRSIRGKRTVVWATRFEFYSLTGWIVA